MNLLDIFLMSALLACTVYGCIQGLLKEIFAVISFTLALFIAFYLYPFLSGFISLFLTGLWGSIIAFILIFIVVRLVAGFLTSMMLKLFGEKDIGFAARVGGGILGFIKGVIIVLFVVSLIIGFFPPKTKFVRNAKSIPYIIKISSMTMPLLPMRISKKYQEKCAAVMELWEHKFGMPPAKKQDKDTQSGNSKKSAIGRKPR